MGRAARPSVREVQRDPLSGRQPPSAHPAQGASVNEEPFTVGTTRTRGRGSASSGPWGVWGARAVPAPGNHRGHWLCWLSSGTAGVALAWEGRGLWAWGWLYGRERAAVAWRWAGQRPWAVLAPGQGRVPRVLPPPGGCGGQGQLPEARGPRAAPAPGMEVGVEGGASFRGCEDPWAPCPPPAGQRILRALWLEESSRAGCRALRDAHAQHGRRVLGLRPAAQVGGVGQRQPPLARPPPHRRSSPEG